MSKNIVLGNIKSHTLNQAFYSKAMTGLRQSLLKGQRPDECSNCWSVEEKNLTSIRMHNIQRLKKDFLLTYLDQPRVSIMDIKFNNTCNFKCRICGPINSSLFAQEQSKWLGIPLVHQAKWEESQHFLNEITRHLANIKNIDMYGGEPFLTKKFSRVLEMAVQKNVAKNIRLHYNSNGSIWPKEFLPWWPHFRQVDIHFSIDAVGKRFELERGGNWAAVEKNILDLKHLKIPNLSISLMPTVSIMNILYLDEVYDWAQKHHFPLFITHYQGNHFKLENLTSDAKHAVLEKFHDHPWKEIQNILEIIRMLPDSDGIAFRRSIKRFDEIRKENFAQSHSEISHLMNIPKSY
jgi:MoaA/NifB/PqqE/SkfB family radical SAM enzyme